MAEEETETPAAPTESAALIVLDGDAAERERIEAMAEELGVDVWAATPEDLVPERPDTWESLSQARAVVVAAQFGPRSGLEILEALRWGGAAAGQTRALGIDRPTRAWIEAALRAGATTCVLRPLEAAELKAKGIVDGCAEAAAEPDEAAEQAEPTEAQDTTGAAAEEAPGAEADAEESAE